MPSADQLPAVELPVDPFTLGVASGDPRPDGVVLWTRLAPTPLSEFVEVAELGTDQRAGQPDGTPTARGRVRPTT